MLGQRGACSGKGSMTRMDRLDRVLITSDDGIDAPGLAVLEQVAAELAREVWIVAPAHDQSGTSHSISLHSPLRIARLGDRRLERIPVGNGHRGHHL